MADRTDIPAPAAPARRTSLTARGEPALWLMGAALALSVLLIVGLLGLIVVQGMKTFWPRPVDRVSLTSGEQFLGVPVQQEAYLPPADVRERLAAQLEAGQLAPEAFTDDGRPIRRLYRVGALELGKEPFRWVPLHEIAATERDPDAVLLERLDWGVFIGVPEAVTERREVVIPAGATVPESVEAPQRIERTILGETPEGATRIEEIVFLASGPDATIATLREIHPQTQRIRHRIRQLNTGPLDSANRRIERQRLRIREAELRLAGRIGAEQAPAPWWLWISGAVATGAAAAGFVVLGRMRARVTFDWRPLVSLGRGLLVLLALALLVSLWLTRPWMHSTFTPAEAQAIVADAQTRIARAEQAASETLRQIAELQEQNDRYRIRVRDIETDRFASQTQMGEPMPVADVVRAVQTNQIGTAGELVVYLSRWWEFLSDDPRRENTEGGVFPVIFGTVLLTLLLSVVVLPLGVVAAIYLREYAVQGPLTSMVRIAVNNLAGVPSIVYGVFGLGFFAYAVGSFVDGGPEQASAPGRWWPLFGGAVVVAASALVAGYFAKPRPGQPQTGMNRTMRYATGALWISAAAMAAVVISTTPYFNGLFPVRAEAGNPVYGKTGLLWASLTLALLTLPVVIVATEEAIAAVPNSAREGSYGCGASQWQTIKRIVLPSAMPGIMTGAILAMARGAGEVAPLMVVGAAKKVSQLPYSGHFPFVHPERSFMHLGFHIYDLGFQSPDSEAARPLVWTTTLLLISIVLLMNLVAITVRARLRARLTSGHF
ncbi:MAG: ABC transporter permease subunit [Phycisphaerales bacterium JB039]